MSSRAPLEPRWGGESKSGDPSLPPTDQLIVSFDCLKRFASEALLAARDDKWNIYGMVATLLSSGGLTLAQLAVRLRRVHLVVRAIEQIVEGLAFRPLCDPDA